MKRKLRSVILIDDDEPTNFLNRMVLKESGCAEEILVFQSATSAMEFLQAATYRPDLIFLDINMPGMNGWEFLEEYEKLPIDKRGKQVVIMLTTSFNPDDRVRAEQISSVSAFRNKPLTPNVLLELLDEFF